LLAKKKRNSEVDAHFLVKEEKLKRTGADFKYKSLVGDRLPPFNFMSGNDPRKN